MFFLFAVCARGSTEKEVQTEREREAAVKEAKDAAKDAAKTNTKKMGETDTDETDGEKNRTRH